MAEITSQAAKARRLEELHHGEMLVLPNIWDPLGALLMQQLGFEAVATASASVAFTHGFDDGENMPFVQVLEVLSSIAASVSLPVTADIESGYALQPDLLAGNIRDVIGTGVAGINLEDSDKQTRRLISAERQCERIRTVRRIASGLDIPLFINARTDVYLRGGDLSAEEKFGEALSRANAYRDAGADCFFPIGMKTAGDISRLVSSLSFPVNILAMPGVPDLKTLKQAGVARVSLGPGMLRVAVSAMQDAAIRLRSLEGLAEVTASPVTMDLLRKLAARRSDHSG